MALFNLSVIGILCVFSILPTPLQAVEWISPGQVCACEGHDVILSWNFTTDAEETIKSYSLCYTTERLRSNTTICETRVFLAHIPDTSTAEVVHQTYAKRIEQAGFVQEGNNYAVNIRMKQLKAGDAGTYALSLSGMEQSSTNDDCKLRVFTGFKEMDATAAAYESTLTEQITVTYRYGTLNPANRPLGGVNVTLTGGGMKRTRYPCPSPCVLNHLKINEGSHVAKATATACGCHRNVYIDVEGGEPDTVGQSFHETRLFMGVLAVVVIVLIIVIMVLAVILICMFQKQMK